MVLLQSSIWVLFIIVLLLMSSQLSTTVEPWPLLGFHLSKHSLANVCITFLDTFFSFRATSSSYLFTISLSTKTYFVLLSFVLWFLTLILVWFDYMVPTNWNVFGRLIVPMENNSNFVANMISSSSSVIPLW